jgi:GH24 family phage-related lysozyme (muramidase)
MNHELVRKTRLTLACAGLTLAAGMLFGCARLRTVEYPALDRSAPGIFLDPVERDVARDVPRRPVSPAGLDLTKASEGFVGRLYHDAAHYCTIAYGHLVKLAPCDGSESEEFRKGVTEPRGAEILTADMERAERAVAATVGVELTDGQHAALCDFVYNVGARNFRTSTLLRVVNARQHEAVPPQLRRWVKAGGVELQGLKARREREIDLYFIGLPRPRGVPREAPDLTPVDVRVGE